MVRVAQPPSAVSSATRRRCRRPRSAYSHFWWGRTLAKLGKRDEAAAKLRRAADLNHALKPETDKLLDE